MLALAAVGGEARADVADPTLRAVADRVVRLELAGAPAVEGRLLGFEGTTVTVALSGSGEVVTLARERVVRVIDIAPPDQPRALGVQMSLLGTLAVDVDYKGVHGFASTNLLLPILTASGEGTWSASAIGAGVALPLGASRWKLDVFGTVLPLHVTSWYTYVGFGVGAGFHYTGASGFTLGITFPVLGFATRIGSSPYGYDPSFRYNDSLGYYYLAGAAGMPLLTMGYRFATRCPRPRARSRTAARGRARTRSRRTTGPDRRSSA